MAGIQRPGAAGVIAVVACCLASFAVSATLWAQTPGDAQLQNPASPLSPLVVDPAAIPSDAALAVVIRPAELADVAAARPMFAAIDEVLVEVKLGLPVSELDGFKGVFISADLLNGPRSILRLHGDSQPQAARLEEGILRADGGNEGSGK